MSSLGIECIDDNLKNVIYSFYTYNEKQKIKAVTKISRWYLKKYKSILTETSYSDVIRYLFINDFRCRIPTDYIPLAINRLKRVGINKPEFIGFRRSDIRRWIMNNMNLQEINYVSSKQYNGCLDQRQSSFAYTQLMMQRDISNSR